MIKNFWRKILKKDMLVVRKTDDEVIRYVKQTSIISERKRFEELMAKDEAKRLKGLNNQEKRLLYFHQLDTLPSRVYDKVRINDEEGDFDFLSDRANYNPLGKKIRRLTYFMPPYAKRGDWSSQMPLKTYVFRVLGSLLMLKLGYELAIWDAQTTNEQFKQNTVVDMETEEQIYDYLYNKDKTAVFLMLYTPGHYFNETFNRDFEIMSSRYK